MITICVFNCNTALDDVGGGVAIIAPGQHTIEDCTFEANSAALAGGGIDYSPPEGEGVNSLTVCDTFFAGNFTSPELMGVGGAISNTNGTLDLQTCVLDSNTATENGGGIYNAGGSVTLTLCVLGGNSATDFGGGIANEIDLTKQGGALTLLSSPDGVLIWERSCQGDRRTVVMNFRDEASAVDLASGARAAQRIEVASDGQGEGELFSGELAGNQAMVLKPD